MLLTSVATLTAAALAASAPPIHSGSCPSNPGISELAGFYDFTTVVLGANNPKARGVNGYYRMGVVVKGCSVEVVIAKYGFSSTIFTGDRLQYGTFPGRVYTTESDFHTDPVQVLFVDADLGAKSGSSLSMGFTFIGNQGFWRYLGSSWETAGMWGALRSRRLAAIDEGPFQKPAKPLTCKHERVGGGTAVAVAFDCGDLIVATPGLDRVMSYQAKEGHAPGGFEKILASGADRGGWLDYCHWFRVHDDTGQADSAQDATRLTFSGGTVSSTTAPDSSRRRCGAKLRPATPPRDRWQGGVR